MDSLDFSGSNQDPWTIYLEVIKALYENILIPLSDVQLQHICSLKKVLPDINTMWLCLRELLTWKTSLMNSLQELEQSVIKTTNSVLFPVTATTSTSSTRAPTQTRLAVVRGCRPVRDTSDSEDDDLDAEFSAMSSRFRTGKTSLDILLQMGGKNVISKAEVQMEDVVFDLKVYEYV